MLELHPVRQNQLQKYSFLWRRPMSRASLLQGAMSGSHLEHMLGKEQATQTAFLYSRHLLTGHLQLAIRGTPSRQLAHQVQSSKPRRDLGAA